MIININLTWWLVSVCLWVMVLNYITSAIEQINYVCMDTVVDEKSRRNSFYMNFATLLWMVPAYLSGDLTSKHPEMLYYFIIFICIHHGIRMLLTVRKYENNIKHWSQFEVYLNMIIYVASAGMMIYLWTV